MIETSLTSGEVAGTQAVREGQGVVQEGLPAGMIGSYFFHEKELIKMIASRDAGESRRCGHCRREQGAGNCDNNGQGGLLATCRLCLVCYSIIQVILKGLIVLKLTLQNIIGC